ncbi:MAG: GDP-L-fucose synthase [Bacteroidota bacterium]
MHVVDTSQPIFVAGHRGLVGSSVVRSLRAQGYTNLLVRTRDELDLRDKDGTVDFFMRERPTHVVMAAAKVGGILANDTYPADFIGQNLAIQQSVIEAAHEAKVERLVFLGSSCIYPKLAPQPMREEHLLTGPLEPTNEWYAVAKIAGIKLCQAYREQYGDDFVSLMPTNLYGVGDNFDLQTSHVLPALVRKFHEAKGAAPDGSDATVTLWGTGTPRREFLIADDLADAVVTVLQTPAEDLYGVAPDGLLNVGVGADVTIAELAETIRSVVGSTSDITYDTTKPDGTPRKLLDVSKMEQLGWTAQTSLHDGIKRVYEWYQSQAVPAV